MFSYRHVAPILLFSLLISACTNALVVNETVIRPYSDLIMLESARRGQMETVVSGTLFEADSDTMSRAVTTAMSNAYNGSAIEFTPTPENTDTGIRAVFLMNAPHGLNIRILCSSIDTVPPQNSTDELRITGGLCKGAQVFRSATAHGQKPTSLNDPLFASYIAAITNHLLSLRNMDRDCGDSPCTGS